jgi:hypothetical protein
MHTKLVVDDDPKIRSVLGRGVNAAGRGRVIRRTGHTITGAAPS